MAAKMAALCRLLPSTALSFSMLLALIAASTPASATAADTAVRASSALEQLAKCNIQCYSAFTRCENQCPDDACQADCAAKHLSDCNCQCQSNIPASVSRTLAAQRPGDARLLSAWRQDAISPNVSTMIGADAALIVRCYGGLMATFNQCANKCAQTDEACIFTCARPAFSGLCRCKNAAPGGGFYDPEGAAKCSKACNDRYDSCVRSCSSSSSCTHSCALTHLVSCNCDCRRYVYGSAFTSFSATSSPALPLKAVAIQSVGAEAGLRGADSDTINIENCVKDQADFANDCNARCTTVKCQAQCMSSSLGEMCHCAAPGLQHSVLMVMAVMLLGRFFR